MSVVRRSIFTRSSWFTSIRAGSNVNRCAVTANGFSVGPWSCAAHTTPTARNSSACRTEDRPILIRLYDGPRFFLGRRRSGLFLQQRLAAQTDLARRVDVDHLYEQ